jgi:hypothetical protein
MGQVEEGLALANFMRLRVLSLSISLILASLSGCIGDIGDGGLFGSDEENELFGIAGGLTLACLQSSKFTTMMVEIDYTAGYEPQSQTLSTLKSRIESVCDKPGGVTIKTTQTDFGHGDIWSPDDVREIGRDTRETQPQDGSTLRWHLLFPNGSYEKSGVLGVAVDASTAAIFLDDVRDAEGLFGRPSAEAIENAVTVHEVGHLLGLVNLVYTSPADHEDSDHPGHSNNENSVMYWAIESGDFSSFFENDVPDDFDSDDRADLAAIAAGDLEVVEQLWS